MNILAGFLTGIAASMGLGGGFILIIYLTFFSGLSQLTAQAANLIFFIPIALLSILMHTKNRLIEWRTIPLCAVGGVIGALVGMYAGSILDETVLRKLFGGLILAVGLRELFHRRKSRNSNRKA